MSSTFVPPNLDAGSPPSASTTARVTESGASPACDSSPSARTDSPPAKSSSGVGGLEGARPLGRIDQLCRRLVGDRLASLRRGRLLICDAAGTLAFGSGDASEPTGRIHVRRGAFYRRVVTGGAVGAAESYLQGDWDSPDLTTAMRVLAMASQMRRHVQSPVQTVIDPVRGFAHWLRRNTVAGSRRNIAAHYDLNNDFFALFLDPTMTYSSGIFAAADMSLEQASNEKYDRICRRLDLSAADEVIEIGSGWGGFAIHAAKHYGARVTTTTISGQQHAYAADRIAASGVADRITLRSDDYRRLSGTFDKLVSIEMIEAVGEKFLPSYFRKCSELLRPDGAAVIQAITMPDHRYDAYRKSVDFIQRYIFPGGFLPSIGAIAGHLSRQTDLRLSHHQDFSSHYARTLAMWREQFWKRIEDVRRLGFDERFIRMWHYYLCYCEAGFAERQVGVSQLFLEKPGSRMEPAM